MLVGLAVTGLLLPACDRTSAADRDATAPDRLSSDAIPLAESLARSTVAAYDTANNEVNATGDRNGLSRIETSPLRDSSEAWMRITTQLKQAVPAITSANPQFLLPPATTRPAWFVAISTRVRGGVPGPAPTYAVYTQSAEDQRWRVAYSLTPSGRVPAPAYSPQRSVIPADAPAGLLMTPDQLGPAIFRHYTEGRAGSDQFARTVALDDKLTNGYAEGRRHLLAEGTALSRTLAGASPVRYGLRTADGGILVFTAATVVDLLKPVRAGGRVTLSAGSNDAAIHGTPNGSSAPQYSITRLAGLFDRLNRRPMIRRIAAVLAKAQTGRAQPFACEQTVGDECAAEAVQVLEQQAGFLESTFLAGSVDAHEDLSGRQDGREAIHVGCGAGAIMHPPRKKQRAARRRPARGFALTRFTSRAWARCGDGLAGGPCGAPPDDRACRRARRPRHTDQHGSTRRTCHCP